MLVNRLLLYLLIISSTFIKAKSPREQLKEFLKANHNPVTVLLLSKSPPPSSAPIQSQKTDNFTNSSSPKFSEESNEFKNRIVKDLRLSEKEIEELNFNSFTFANQLLEFIRKKKKIPSHNPFWYDLERLLFKWTLAVREILAGDDSLFESSIKSVKLLLKIILKDGFGFDDKDISKLEDQSIFSIFSIFSRLLQYELLDNPQVLKYFIGNVRKDLYDDNNNMKLKIDCKQLENKHFNEHFNTNTLLKLTILQLVPLEIGKELKNKCFSNENLNFHDNPLLPLLLKLYSGEKLLSTNIDKIESINENYINVNTVKFFQKYNFKFRIYSIYNFIRLLRRLDRIGKLEKNLIGNFKFTSTEEGNLNKNLDIFKEYLEMTRRADDILSQDEYKRYIKLVE